MSRHDDHDDANITAMGDALLEKVSPAFEFLWLRA
jgi:hypothetical protein